MAAYSTADLPLAAAFLDLADLLPPFSSSSSIASIGFNLSCSAVYLELQSPFLSAFVLAGFLLTVRFSGGIVSGCPRITSRLPLGDTSAPF